MNRAIGNFLKGTGSLLDIQPVSHKGLAGSVVPSHSDLDALRKDWARVGQDLAEAFGKIRDEQHRS